MIVFRYSVHYGEVLVFVKKVAYGESLFFAGKCSKLNDNIFFVINYGIEFFGRHSEQVTNLIRQRMEIPYMSHRNGKLDMPRTFAANLLFGNFDAATVAYDAFVADTLVFTAMTLVVAYRSEDTFAKQTVSFGAVGTVVYRFGFGYFAIGVFQYLFGRGKTDSNFLQITFYLIISF